ncbi:MAG TPA: LacI family DNA-binding transcriptional regulator [Thermoanaerobaculia bacterium]|nr:LacI family DNA-binding transcriptional regulator [Thermoanaerobaculia bacterium]
MTIREVARAAAVSVATVSRVLNESGPVRDETSRRIRDVVERLRYSPHGAARSLITRRTSTLGVLLPDLYGEFFSELIRGIDSCAREGGYHVLVSGSHSDRAEIEAVLRATRGRVDGLIVMSPDLDARALNPHDGLPIVLLNGNGRRFDSIHVDNYGGALAMVRHLIGLGHRRIAHLSGPAGNRDAAERLRGYRDAMRTVSRHLAKDLVIDGDFREEAGYRAGPQLLDRKDPPTAVFAANDSMAIGLLAAFQESGVRVPGDVAVTGFDDIPIARFTTPALSTVRVPIAELGSKATRRLLQRLSSSNGHAVRHETLATTLVVRDSSGGRIREGVPADTDPTRPPATPHSHRSDFQRNNDSRSER